MTTAFVLPRGPVSTDPAPGLRLLVRIVAVAALANAASCGPSAQRRHCVDYCEQNNNTCIAQATTGPALQECSAWTSSCVAACPP
jgi:hypothetical protein